MNVTCRRCGETKPQSEFVIDIRNTHGKSSWCRDCFQEQYNLHIVNATATAQQWQAYKRKGQPKRTAKFDNDTHED